jgi:peptidoglycan-N-acetylmuramic acid deacetylase
VKKARAGRKRTIALAAVIVLLAGGLVAFTGKEQLFPGLFAAGPAGVGAAQPAPEQAPGRTPAPEAPLAGKEEKPAPAPAPAENKPATAPPAPGSSQPDRRYGWGIKRNDNHQPPEVPAYLTSLLAKYESYWIGDTTKKVVYLTFDEGYENGYTPKILDILKEQQVPAAFFITGHYLKTQPELVKRMVAEGHIVGNHTVNHPSLPDLNGEEIKKEVEQLAEDFASLTGKKMVYLRPPKGEFSERTLAQTRKLGYHNIFWSLALVDWVPMPGGPDESYRTVMDNLHNGALILLHAVSRDNTEALERIIKDIRAKGYTFATLDDLVEKR